MIGAYSLDQSQRRQIRLLIDQKRMENHVRNHLIALSLQGGVQLAFAPVLPGDLSVTILPENAAKAGAQWQVDGGPLQNSGAITTVPTGSHTITFTMISGWITPDDEVVYVTLGQSTI